MLNSTRQLQTGDPWTTRSGVNVVFRPIGGDDEDAMVGFHRCLSSETVYARYFNVLKLSERITHERMNRICHPALHDETVLVVEIATPFLPARQIIGVGRLSAPPGAPTGEVAFVVGDSYQRQGIGSELLRRILEVARERRLRRVRAHVLNTNVGMRRACVRAGMRLVGDLNDSEMKLEIEL
jgi:acetyltransferase